VGEVVVACAAVDLEDEPVVAQDGDMILLKIADPS
jgi:hypothetical protein